MKGWTNRMGAIGLTFLLAAGHAAAVPISSGYATEHFYRECATLDIFGVQTRCAEANVDFLSLPTYYGSFSITGVSMSNDPATAQSLFDRGHDPNVVGTALSEARAPSGASLFPELAAFGSSSVTTRTSTVTSAVQRYVNTSGAPIDISLTGRIDGTIDKETSTYTEVDSAGNTVSQDTLMTAGIGLFTTVSDNIDTDLARSPGAIGNDGFWNALCIRQLSGLGAATDGCATDINRIFQTQQVLRADGAINSTFDPTGSFLTLAPGESVWVAGFLATVAINGGTADAFSTLTTALIDPATGRTLTRADGLRPVGVPAPGALALLLTALLGLSRIKRHRC